MESSLAIAALAALAQPTRLDAFRLLVAAEPLGLPAGEIARRLDVPPNTLSAHLATLSHAGLVAGTRASRQVIYRADLAQVQALTLFLLKDCCGGEPSLCAPVVAALAPCCQPVAARWAQALEA